MKIFNFQFSIFKSEEGFTLVELLLAIGIAGILLSLTTIGLLNAQRTTSLVTAEESLIADIKSQQIKAMNGIQGSGNFGIHFASTNTYTLFQGSTFGGASSTSPVSLDDNITLSGSDVIFSKVSGEITTPATITVTNTANGTSKTIQMNKYGVITGD
jgi:prepilin-type N-terminal cleavage/methylation domain-containing protein